MSDPQAPAPLQLGRVLVIDDYAVADPWYEDQTSWEGFVLSLSARQLSAFPDERIDDLRKLEPAARNIEVVRIRGELGDQVVDDLLGADQADVDITHRWLRRIGELSSAVATRTGSADLAAKAGKAGVDRFLTGFDLILLDYQFGRDDGGAESKAIAKQIAAAVRKTKRSDPPLLIKFSSRIVEKDANRSLFAGDVGYPRGCYEFLAKAEIYDDSFDTVLRSITEGGSLGRKLYRAADTISKTLAEEAGEQVGEMLIRSLDPTAMRLMFSERLLTEGMSEPDYLVEIIINLVSAKVRQSVEVAAAVRAFLDEMGPAPAPGAPADASSLHDLEYRLRYDYSVNEFRRPIDFGDIFLPGDGRFAGILLTPRSDLMIRGGNPKGRNPAARWLTLGIGDVSSEPVRTGERVSTGANESLWVRWTDELIAVPRPTLDLVTLTDDGRAEIVDGHPSSPYWTLAYEHFIAKQLDLVRTSLSAPPKKNGDRMLRLGVTSEPYPFGFGTALVAAGGQHLPIRRICRLRWVDAMALLQRASNKASRIGLAPELDPTVSTEKVALFSGNRQIGTIEARVTSVGDAKPTRVDVESAELRTQVRGRAEFANLAKLSAEYPGHFNILAAKPEYAISPATGDPRLWKVRAPAPGSRQPPQDRERSVPTEDGPS